MAGLINVQGLHAPLRLAMERRAVQQVGRLPFLPSSNLHLQVTLSYYTTRFECTCRFGNLNKFIRARQLLPSLKDVFFTPLTAFFPPQQILKTYEYTKHF